MNRLLLGLLSVLIPVALSAQPSSSSYPSKPLRFIVGFPPGGSADPTTRIIGAALAEQLGQPVVVENRPGADSALAAEQMTRVAPDGYTIMFASNSAMTAAVALRKQPAYDPLKDFTPISMVGRATVFFYAHPDVPAKTLAEFIAHARANPGKLNYGTGNPLSILYNVQLMNATGINMLHVPYKGGSPAAAATVAGETAAMWSGSSNAPQIKAGRLRPLAVSGGHRSAQYPELPTISEFYPGFENSIWLGLFAPAGVSDEVLAKLRTEIRKVLESPDVKQKMNAAGGLDPYIASPDEFAALIKRDYAKYAKVVKDIGLKVD
jgi:tripartite-type tricarboxylate transporter receptor subunit TctC